MLPSDISERKKMRIKTDLIQIEDFDILHQWALDLTDNFRDVSYFITLTFNNAKRINYRFNNNDNITYHRYVESFVKKILLANCIDRRVYHKEKLLYLQPVLLGCLEIGNKNQEIHFHGILVFRETKKLNDFLKWFEEDEELNKQYKSLGHNYRDINVQPIMNEESLKKATSYAFKNCFNKKAHLKKHTQERFIIVSREIL